MPWQNSIVARKLFGLNLMVMCLLLLSSCTVQFVALYDQQTDTSVTTLQRRVETFLVELESLDGLPECSYENHTSFYQEAKVDVKAIRIRAAAIPQNDLTTKQVMLLEENLVSLEELHKDHCLIPDELQLLRTEFDSAFTAILKLELAKQRGKS